MGRILQTDDPDKLYQRGRPVMLRAAGPAVDAVEDNMLAAAHDLSQLRASLAQCGVSAVAYSGPDGASPMAMMCHSGPASPTWGGGGGATPPAFQFAGGVATPPAMDLGNSPETWSSLPMSLAAFAAAAGVTPMAAEDEHDGWIDAGEAAVVAAAPAPVQCPKCGATPCSSFTVYHYKHSNVSGLPIFVNNINIICHGTE